MLKTILRKEHKNRWEKRVAISPTAAGKLKSQGYQLDVESSEDRIYPDSAYQSENLTIVGSPHSHQLVLGIKEPPIDSIQEGQVHLCFSHTIKGQDYNMPLLQRFLDQQATLIDYELMKDERGIRTIAFGRFAGIAGAIDTLWLYSQLLERDNIQTILSKVTQSWEYGSVAVAEKRLSAIDINQDQKPLRIIILGNGKVGLGCAEVCRWLGLPEIKAEDISAGHYDDEHHWFSVLDVSEMYAKDDGSDFDREEYYQVGKAKYHSRFKEMLGHCDVVLMSSFWTAEFPRHMELDDFNQYSHRLPKILGDISCDISGAFACTLKVTDIDNPVYTYFPDSQTIADGLHEEGMAIMAIDNLPCELSQDASDHFSSVLVTHLPDLMEMDTQLTFEELEMSPEVKDSIIVFRGELTPKFSYLKQFL